MPIQVIQLLQFALIKQLVRGEGEWRMEEGEERRKGKGDMGRGGRRGRRRRTEEYGRREEEWRRHREEKDREDIRRRRK